MDTRDPNIIDFAQAKPRRLFRVAGLERAPRCAHRQKAWLRYWLFRRWWPEPCRDCGKRFGHHDDCLPF
jgi:hypothetical protein